MEHLSACHLALLQLYAHFSLLLTVLRCWGERLRAFKDARSEEKNNFQCFPRAAAVVSAGSLPSSGVLCAKMDVQATVSYVQWHFGGFP